MIRVINSQTPDKKSVSYCCWCGVLKAESDALAPSVVPLEIRLDSTEVATLALKPELNVTDINCTLMTGASGEVRGKHRNPVPAEYPCVPFLAW